LTVEDVNITDKYVGYTLDSIKVGEETVTELPKTVENGTTVYNATNEFFTINLNCVSAIKCYADTFVDLC